jgi:threonine aldolase
MIDMRSDTVTQPTPEMRQAMFEAEVGDDVYGEDPTVNKLQELAAKLSGKEAALFVPSGTMANLAAMLSHCQRGDEIIIGNLAHPYLNEAGGLAALGSIHPFPVENQENGRMRLEDIKLAIRVDDVHHPITRLIALENTHNRRNGAALPSEYINEVADLAHENKLALHIDGARIFNAAEAVHESVADLAKEADTLTICLSKGLCAPVGSLICGSQEFIDRALRTRKMMGGGMRQAGILAAAGIIALNDMPKHLGEDHRRAELFAEGMQSIGHLSVSPQQTNIVRFTTTESSPLNDDQLHAALAKQEILIGHGGAWGLRAVTHYWVSDDDIAASLSSIKSLLN